MIIDWHVKSEKVSSTEYPAAELNWFGFPSRFAGDPCSTFKDFRVADGAGICSNQPRSIL
jgi:hypothetical protein